MRASLLLSLGQIAAVISRPWIDQRQDFAGEDGSFDLRLFARDHEASSSSAELRASSTEAPPLMTMGAASMGFVQRVVNSTRAATVLGMNTSITDGSPRLAAFETTMRRLVTVSGAPPMSSTSAGLNSSDSKDANLTKTTSTVATPSTVVLTGKVSNPSSPGSSIAVEETRTIGGSSVAVTSTLASQTSSANATSSLTPDSSSSMTSASNAPPQTPSVTPTTIKETSKAAPATQILAATLSDSSSTTTVAETSAQPGSTSTRTSTFLLKSVTSSGQQPSETTVSTFSSATSTVPCTTLTTTRTLSGSIVQTETTVVTLTPSKSPAPGSTLIVTDGTTTYTTECPESSGPAQSQTTSTVVVMYSGQSSQSTPTAMPTTALPEPDMPSPVISAEEAGFTVTQTTTIVTSTFTDIISISLETSYVQTTTTLTEQPQTSGAVFTTFSSSQSVPFPTTVVPSPESSISPILSGTAAINSSSNDFPTPVVMLSGNIFQPVATDAPPSNIPQRGGHPVPKLGINQKGTIETNKFYANFFLGTQQQGTWTHPYSVAWAKGTGNAKSYGLSISHISRSQLVYGPGDPASYFVNPVGIQSMILSASQLGSSTSMTIDGTGAFQANINFAPVAGASPILTCPLVQGMGFVTGVYSNATPLIQSSVFFSKLTYNGLVQGSQTARYTVALNDGTQWLIYLTGAGNSAIPTLTLTSNSAIAASGTFSGSVQIAKNPNGGSSMAVYDASAGVYPLRGAVSGQVNNATGTYQLAWTKGGVISKSLLMFALPHHIQELPANFSPNSRSALALETTTKGVAMAVVGDAWTLTEKDLPYDMTFAPWSPTLRSRSNIPSNAASLLRSVSSMELAENFTAQCDLDSMYFSGKGLAKFAMMLIAANDLAGNTGAASAGLAKLKTEFGRFVSNQQINPLVYDTVWGGAVSSCSYVTGDSGCDFGNTYYNDHHFHYGYFVYTAAVIAHLDPSWLQQGTNKAWVNMLVRDYANSVGTDPYFPFSRMYDWYNGHSWAHGLYETADGKDEESSSEDAFSSYALKMWGRIIGDANMEARGNLMLAVTARSLQNYFLMETNNTVQPPKFINNRASGILFENKIDHTTYFGTNIEYIEGIHMLPLNPSSTLTRTVAFVTEEWNQYFSNGRADQVAGGWRGILYANLAIIDPRSSYNFFASSSFNNAYLDGGASRSWYLAMAAALGGAS